ncbi:hypothetical protein RvY_01571 [Ramazzottius varieornatus]|uniref:Uncharacterized protein n=1 Tax=Ramazzottius varieornatus TaxID=947166 RepID=A0A1D1UKN3_RAMVA|nr:hypothetical protein RvY_01571 [Ramazzottius varieornatus]
MDIFFYQYLQARVYRPLAKVVTVKEDCDRLCVAQHIRSLTASGHLDEDCPSIFPHTSEMRFGALSSRKSQFLPKVFYYFLPFLALLLASVCGGQSSMKKERAQLLAVPWQDKHPTESNRFTFEAKTCSISVSPIHAQNEPTKGIFTHFVLAGWTYLAKISFFNGRFSTVEVHKIEVVNDVLHFHMMACTRITHSALEIKAGVCSDREAYLVVLLTKDGITSEPQLLVFKHDDKDPSGEKYVIAHNSQLSSARGVADVSISCVENHAIFAFAASTALSGTTDKEVHSSIRIWSPKTRAVRKVLTVPTENAVSVVTFRSRDCQVHVFAQKTNGKDDVPFDTLIYCVRPTEGSGDWSLELLQAIPLCDVYGVDLYTNNKQELGMFVAISKKSKFHPQCPKSSLALKWTEQRFEVFKNITLDAVADFYYLPTPCCSFLLARHIGAERILTIVGSTESLFDGVLKMEHLTVSDRQYLLISFVGEMHQGALHEVACSKRSPIVQTPAPTTPSQLGRMVRPRGGSIPPTGLLLAPPKPERMILLPPAQPLPQAAALMWHPTDNRVVLPPSQMPLSSFAAANSVRPRMVPVPFQPVPMRYNFTLSFGGRWPSDGVPAPSFQPMPPVQQMMPPQNPPPYGSIFLPSMPVRYLNASRQAFQIPPMIDFRPPGYSPTSVFAQNHPARSNTSGRRTHRPVQYLQHVGRAHSATSFRNHSLPSRSWTPNLRRLNDKLEDFA